MNRAIGLVIALVAGLGCRSNDPDRTDGRPPDLDTAVDVPPFTEPDPPTIVVGAPDHILLKGAVVTPEIQFVGEVLVEADKITCVDAGTACEAMPNASGATIIDTKGVIAPGLIDTHNHILFDIFDDSDWHPAQLYQDHDQWPNEPRYNAMLDVKQCLVDDSQGRPAWCAMTPYGTSAGSLRCEVDKFGELKGLVAGTTSIVGLPGTSAACFGSLTRSVDVAQNELGVDQVQTSALYPPSDPNGVCTNYASGKTTAFLLHAGEGVDAKAAAEFDRLGTMTTTPNCLYAPQTAITHGTAFTPAQFATMASFDMKLIWSPHSNVSLYGTTADIPSALDAGVKISLAPDWSMGGSQNLLEELRFADAWDNAHWNDRLAPQDLVTMVTRRGAQVLGLDATLGSLEVGKIADISVFTGTAAAPYDAIVAAKPASVRLVMVGGVVLYGDSVLQAAGPATPGCETIDICGAAKFLCVARTSTANKLNQTFAQITTALGDALTLADSLTTADGFDFAPLTQLVTCP
ncbi:MAG: amidohydrolase family protein [Deltaproteobacteria bacterium]